MLKSGIYKLQSKINKATYVGGTLDLKRRKNTHFNVLGRQKSPRLLQDHYNKYGKNDLEFFIIETCSKKDLLHKEQYWIDTLNPELNSTNTAYRPTHTEKTKQKISKAHIGKKQGPCSEEAKRKISQAHKGRKFTEKHKQALIDSCKKRKNVSQETKQKMSISAKQRHQKRKELNV